MLPDQNLKIRPVRQLPPHRILALNRGESKNCLKLTLNYPADSMLTKLAQKLKIQPHTVWNELYTNAVADSYKRLLFPSLERELRNELTEKAEKQAISVFAANLRQLLLQQPIARSSLHAYELQEARSSDRKQERSYR